jgi:hypothetical protein
LEEYKQYLTLCVEVQVCFGQHIREFGECCFWGHINPRDYSSLGQNLKNRLTHLLECPIKMFYVQYIPEAIPVTGHGGL